MLSKQDLGQIEEIVERIVKATVGEAEKRIEERVVERVVSQITREINDLAEINRAVIGKVSIVDNHEVRLVRIEDHLQLTPSKS